MIMVKVEWMNYGVIVRSGAIKMNPKMLNTDPKRVKNFG